MGRGANPAEAVARGIRSAKKTTVRVTNYRKDGSAFLNMLSLRPIVDASGAFRFMIGIIVEVTDSFSQMKPKLMQVDRLLKLLPTARRRRLDRRRQRRVSIRSPGCFRTSSSSEQSYSLCRA